MSSESYHEPLELLDEETRNLHRAIVTLIEELEAVDWYQRRARACSDEELRAVISHNQKEEVEHAMMTLEWLRRNNPHFASNIALYLGSAGPIVEVEEATDRAEVAGANPVDSDDSSGVGSLGIGSLKGVK